MENLLLALSIARAQVKDLEWLIEQSENRLRENQNLLKQAQGLVTALEKSEQEMKNLKSKAGVLQVDLDRIAEKNRKWARETVDRIMSEGKEDSHPSGIEAPQWNMSYWRFEGPKLKQRVLDLEAELEALRSKTVWKDQ